MAQRQGGKEFCSVDHKPDNVNGFQELRLDETETLKCDFANGQHSLSLPQVPTDLANNTQMEGAYASSVQNESQEAGRNQITTVCVWCVVEFNYDAVDSEIQPNSVGFM